MTLPRLGVLAACLLVALSPSAAKAQGPETGLPDPAKCVVYSRALETGHPAPFLAEARSGILACKGQVGHAYSAWLDRLSASATRDDANSFLEMPVLLRDGELFATALRVAANQGASTLAREAALVTLLNQSGSIWAGPLTAYERGEVCSVGEPATPRPEIHGSTPLPTDYLTAASAVIDSTSASSEPSDVVRAVAKCVKKNFYRRTHYLRDLSPALHPNSW